MTPRILLPGKLTSGATGVRGDSYSNGLRYAEAIARARGVVLTVPPLAESLPPQDAAINITATPKATAFMVKTFPAFIGASMHRCNSQIEFVLCFNHNHIYQ